MPIPVDFKKTKDSDLRFIHLTDTHLLDHAEDTLHGINTKNNLLNTLIHSQNNYPNVDFLLFTGDISQTGNMKSYQVFQSIINQFEVPVICIPGNHDTPQHLQKFIPSCPDQSINIICYHKISLILMNSWIKDRHHGELNSHCLQQLEMHLQNAHSQFNIFAIHHPPIAISSEWLDELGLKNPSALLRIIDQSAQPSLLLCGHIHQQVDLQLNKLRLLATPSTCHQFKPGSNTRCHQPDSCPSYRYISISPDYTIQTKVHAVI